MGFFLSLGLVPDLVHFGQCKVFEVLAALAQGGFQVVEASDELAVGSFEGIVGIDVIEPGGIDQTEEHVAHFGFGGVGIQVFYFGLELADFFFDLFPYL